MSKFNLLEGINVQYQPGIGTYWTGRRTALELGDQYWHQAIECWNVHHIQKEIPLHIALLGYACDEGVRRNLGRVGAKQGPNAIREKLAKIPVHFESKLIADCGDLVCIEEDMESCQLAFARFITYILDHQIFTIGMGGGHDIAYGHFKGVYDAVVKMKPNAKIGIVNFDAHFDLRTIEERGNSGTPFNQILSEYKNADASVDYLVMGIQQQSNTKELYSIADTLGVQYVNHSDCVSYHMQNAIAKLNAFIAANDYIYLSIDMDGFSAAYAMGVSAPSALGFAPDFVYQMLHILFASKKVISCDIAELNPTYDQDQLTASLAAKLIDYIVSLL